MPVTVVDLLRKLLETRNERGETTSARFRMAARRIARRMLGESNLPVLDLAGREGLLFDPGVSPLARETTVLDIETPPLREAKTRYHGLGQFVCGDLTRLPFRDDAFGASVCVGTFYNLPDEALIRAGLREMARVTRPGGRVIAEFRNAANPYMRIAKAWAARYDPTLAGLPVRAYSAAAVRRLAEESGLGIVRIRRAGFPFGPWALMLFVEATPSPQKRD